MPQENDLMDCDQDHDFAIELFNLDKDELDG
jgi:hypothetical protein